VPNSRFLFTEGTPDINSMSECDIVVVQRLMMDANIKFLEIARAHGLKVVYDLDDLVWHLPASNPAARFFHRDESISGLRNCAEWADVITVSTKELRKATIHQWGMLRNVETGKEIEVVHIDNCVNFDLFHLPLLEKDEDKVVIGWGGSNTHEGDVATVWKLLPDILSKYHNVFLEFVGQKPPASLRFHERVKERPWCHISEFHNRLATWNWDIVLAPLEAHKFNRSKSSIKMQEAGAIGAPCLAQDITPYQYFCSFTKSLEWLLCDDWDWEKKLCKLIEDKSMRRDLGQLMYANTLVNFNVERTAKQWIELSASLV
jgi:glycosyltransferase involved in cell wall biosynthesis